MDNFVKLQPLKSMQNVFLSRKIQDLVEGYNCNLTRLGVPRDTYGKKLFRLLIVKISHALRLVISREFEDQVCELENMLKHFNKESFVKERCASFVDKKQFSRRNKNSNINFFVWSKIFELCFLPWRTTIFKMDKLM